MPFGIPTAPKVFQTPMYQVLQGGTEAVMDDTLVWATQMKSVMHTCAMVKFQFCKTKVRYLECVLNNKGLSVDPNSAEDILAVQVLENGKEVKTFLVCC